MTRPLRWTTRCGFQGISKERDGLGLLQVLALRKDVSAKQHIDFAVSGSKLGIIRDRLRAEAFERSGASVRVDLRANDDRPLATRQQVRLTFDLFLEVSSRVLKGG